MIIPSCLEYRSLASFILNRSFMMGVRIHRRLPGALAGLLALALMAVAVTTTLNAQTTTTVLAPRLAARAVTTGDVSTYKLVTGTQLSGGLWTVALGEPWYLEIQVDATIAAKQITGVTWTLTTKPLKWRSFLFI